MPGKQQKFTITSTVLNALSVGEFISTDVTLDYSTKALNASMRPQAIRFDNGTGGDYGYVLLSNEYEIAEQVAHPEWYAPVPLPSDISDLNSATNTKYLYIFKLATTSATGNLDIYCVNYSNQLS